MATASALAATASPESRDEITVRALVRVFEFWRVTGAEAARLAGVSGRTWSRMKAEGWNGSLSEDQRMRASALIGLYKGLHLYFGDALADAWVKMPNRGPLFEGRTPLGYMLERGFPGILAAREYIDAVRGGM